MKVLLQKKANEICQKINFFTKKRKKVDSKKNIWYSIRHKQKKEAKICQKIGKKSAK